MPFNWDNVGGLNLNNCPMKDLDDSDPINDRNSQHYGAPDSSFITPGCVKEQGKYVDWVDDGPAGYGSVWKSMSVSGAPDNSSLSHFSAMTRKYLISTQVWLVL